MKYKILVADDEYIIRRGIIKLLLKYEDLEVVAEAEDGEQALEIAEKIDLDILFVDINMPFVNGLQFIEKLKSIQPNVIVNIITGYDKFDYVRQAIKLGVFEYILKPLNESAFDDTIKKIVTTLNKKSDEAKFLKWAKVTLDKNKSNLVGEFLEKCNLLNYTEDKIKEEFEYLGLNIPKQFTMSLIYLERVENVENLDIRQHWNDSLLYCTAENIARELFDRLAPVLICRNSKGYLILICRTESKNILEIVNQEYKSVVEKYIPVNVSMLQQSDNDCYQLPRIYHDLLKKMEDVRGYPSLIKEIKLFIESNYYRENISLLEAAEHVNLSPQHLSRIFKKEMQINFIDYLTQVRLGKAIELFENEDLKMYEIADRIGYTTQHYFSSVFKKVLGVSPLEYRNQCKSMNKEKNYELSR
ncbi:MAG: response regulator transcription factor [Mobilitalea sp.]